jgi:hypothetical protein
MERDSTRQSGDDPLAEEEAAAAAAEAAAIGGVAGDEDLDPAERPVREAGGGEAEGFEIAEDDLIEHASHGDQHSGRIPFHHAGRPEEAGATAEGGEADAFPPPALEEGEERSRGEERGRGE